MPGRPSHKVEVSLTNPLRSVPTFLSFYDKNENSREETKKFARVLFDATKSTSDNITQIEATPDNAFDMTSNFTSYEKSALVSNIVKSLHPDYQVLIEDFDMTHQSEIFALLGNSLNKTVYEASQRHENEEEANLKNLQNINKENFYAECDVRLASFIDAITAKQNINENNLNFKSNVYENILKARNTKYVSKVGLKEHMVTYLSSNKSRNSTQVFSKQGAKGTRPLLEKVLQNSEIACEFETPEKSSLFFSFDNIQTLFKSHRIGGEEQKKVLAIVVCSIMCVAWAELTRIQFLSANSPACWYAEYTYDSKKDVYIDKLDSKILKTCAKIENEEEENIISEYFEKELETAIVYVNDDMNKNNIDSIDLLAKQSIAKRRKLCEKNHINNDVTSDRKVCDRAYCKPNIKKDSINNHIPAEIVHTLRQKNSNKENTRADMYLNVPNVHIDDEPKEHAVGAIAVNPNKRDRIALVLDTIIEAAGMKNNYPVKLVFSDKKVSKILNDDPEVRKFVVVSADGLPYKVLIDLIRNAHTCATCGKRIDFISEVTDHMNTTHHKDYFQTYGSIIPNIGQFHYSLTLLRSLVKLDWDIDYQAHVKSIHFETPKALFMQQKVTDFRKSLDTYRCVRRAKLRELVTPFVKHARENFVDIDVKSYLAWNRSNVKCEMYKAVFQIEKYYGTSFLLYHAALRANNQKLAQVAKKSFQSIISCEQKP